MLGRSLVAIGLAIAALGLAIEFFPALRLGRLPGDVSFGGANWRVSLPIGTSILLSILLTLVFWIVGVVSRR